MSESESKLPAPTDESNPEPGPAEGKRSWLSWAVGWVLVPGALLGLIWGAGVLVGVHLHESWLSRLVVWTVDLF